MPRAAQVVSLPTFPPFFEYSLRHPITLVELRMRQFSSRIRAKPNWLENVSDPAVVAEWREEILELDRALLDKCWGGEKRFEHGDGKKKWPREPITDAQVDYIFAELQHVASSRDESGILPTSVFGTYESRSLISMQDSLAEELIRAAAILEPVTEEDRNLQPGTSTQVIDLLDPSLYCLRIGDSFVRKGDQTGSDPLTIITREAYVARRPDVKYCAPIVASKFQWLPTDIYVPHNGPVQVLGYINNLHPTLHQPLYRPLSSVLGRFITLFERVLADAIEPESHRAVDVDSDTWYDHLETPDLEDERREEWERANKWPLVPDPQPFEPVGDRASPTFSLRGRQVQVIIKLTTVVLTPDNPKYPGGAYHFEGTANENVLAVGLYCYGRANTTEARLDFRAVADELSSFEQYDLRGYAMVYGFGSNHDLSLRLGHIVIDEGECIAFPNTYQHRLDAFGLADASKPGHCKLLYFFLVNPETRILSTADVPPQQQEWSFDEAAKSRYMESLPDELFGMIAGYVKGAVISRKEAGAVREDLLKERSILSLSHVENEYEVMWA